MKNSAFASMLFVLLAGCASATSANEALSVQKWVATWGAAPAPPVIINLPPPATTPAAPGAAPPAIRPPPGLEPVVLNNETVRNVVRISAGGQRIRLRFTNEFGAKPLAIGAASVSLADAAGAIVPNTTRVVKFGGKTSTVIAQGAPLFSDAIDLPVKALGTLSISVFFPEDAGACTCHTMGLQQAYVSAPGDFTAAAEFQPARTISARPFISGVDVEVKKGGAIVAIGDSITDGAGSSAGANRRWPDRLAERLVKARLNEAWGVVNAGMSGNRMMMEGIGPSALARFDRDVLAQSGVAYVIVVEGINDLGVAFGRRPPGGVGLPQSPQKPTADVLIHGYRQLIARAHARGVKVIGATIAPYQGANYWSEEGEAERQAVNKWIRTGGEFDGIIDFDAALRDPSSPLKIADGKHSGDHLHGSDAGYEAAANAINLRLFK